MTASVQTDVTAAARAHARGTAAQAVASVTAQLRGALDGVEAAVVLYFASAAFSPADLAAPLAAAFAEATVIGCSTAGEFTDQTDGVGGLSTLALPAGLVRAHPAVLADLHDPVIGARAALADLAVLAGEDLRDLDPTQWFGLLLVDGVHGAEESVNEEIDAAAPLLEVVGGSAGDDLAFERTWVAVGDRVSECGMALVLVHATVPFRVLRTTSCTSTGRPLLVTRCDVATRTVLELDGRPAAEVYAAAVGHPRDAVDTLDTVFPRHPVGLMVDGDPFVRSPQRVVAGGGIRFSCQMVEGMRVDVLDAGDVVADTAAAVLQARDALGAVSGAVFFNSVHRRLVLAETDRPGDFVRALGGIPSAGFHTYGESWLGHLNHTLTGIVLGRP
ncbi:FIST signal transduction protein [Lapillicoccus jejuensis]|uniref:FIST-like protein n=1 Tax=Lapillicoccus jejuensis TaxID=402171 RepID=A0A542DWE0_9MICO|nr:FIST N-terminal domain-containing protein [Lapillicoccus jejuensis]TQJ07412.1 hypothetical protein FB458_0474 [Lapillicoccus jejuensis]